jgi:hypothetical protein
MSFWRVRLGPKFPIHRKSSIRALKVRKLFLRAFDDFVMKSPFDLGYEIKGLVVAKSYYLLDCLPMGGLGSSCSSK